MTPTDVTPRSFSVVWASDVAFDDATLRLYSDAAGTNEITGTKRCTSNPALSCTSAAQCAGAECLQIVTTLASPAAAKANGVAKVTVTGLGSGRTYYFRIQTTVGGTPSSDGAAPRSVTTAQRVRLAGTGSLAVVSDLIPFDLRNLVMTGNAPGALLVVDTDAAAYPVSAFSGDGYAAPRAVVNLANLYDSTGETLQLAGDEPLEIIEFRGILAGDMSSHQLHHFRKVPLHEEDATLGVRNAALESPGACFSPCDFNCNDAVGLGDLALFGAVFPTTKGQSRYNPDFDLNQNDGIGLGDFSLFGSCFPSVRH